MDSSTKKRKIAKNTILLYCRMFVLLLISFYTSRIILEALGVEDYGIYNVVGGIVTTFALISSTLNAAITRFITYELGKGDIKQLSNVFSTALNIQVILCIVVVVISETVGIWFLNNRLVIPPERLAAANWVFQFSIVSFCIQLISVPYNSEIVAHEDMSAFAYISIFEALGKLAVAALIPHASYDKLIIYAFLLTCIYLTTRYLYGRFCHKHYEETKYHFIIDKDLLRKMFTFSGWNLIGAGSYVLMYNGVDFLINIFFGVTVNAARGVAATVNRIVMQFVQNFTTAIKPQITKSYAENDTRYMFELVFKGARISYLMLLFIAVPLMAESNLLISLWLKEVPENAPLFANLIILVSLISVLSETMYTAIMASEDIKIYQICVGGIGMLVFPIVWIAFKFGLAAYYAYIIQAMIFILQLLYRIFYMKKNYGMGIRDFFSKVIYRIGIVTIVSSIAPISIVCCMSDGINRLLIVGTCFILLYIPVVYFWGLEKDERRFVMSKVNSLIKKKHE